MNNKDRSVRPETGPMKFGEDWTGLFIRGDNAFAYAVHLENVIRKLEEGGENSLDLAFTKELLVLLSSADERLGSDGVQALKEFSGCKE